ncbi:MAG: sulfur oxidation c-type cytochrome SoxX, partial [Gammaproteobacteria bacterium]
LVLMTSHAYGGSLSDGKQLAFERSKGNCLACHAIADGEMAGNIGPPLINMKQRFPERSELKQQIWDATIANPKTSMPPFGRNKILSKDEIELVVEYIWSL